MIEALLPVVEEVVLALAPLLEAADSPDQARWLLSELGWTPASIPHPIVDLAAAGSDLVNVISSDADVATAQQSLAAVGGLLAAINEISQGPDAAFPSGVDVAEFKATIGPDLLDYLLVEHLLRHHYGVGAVLLLTGFIRLVPQPASGLRQPYLRRQVNWNALSEMLQDPAAGFRDAFDWNSAAPQLTSALGTFGSLLERYGLAFTYFHPSGDLLTFLTSGVDPASYNELGIDVAWDTATTDEAEFRAGLQLAVLPATASRSAAIGFFPYLTESAAAQIPIADGLTLSADGNADLTKGMALIFAPGQPLDVRTGFLGGTAGGVAGARVILTYTPPDDSERVLLGTEDGSRLSIRGLSVTSGVALVGADQVDVSVQVDLVQATVAVVPDADGTDSFVADLLEPDGFTAQLSPGFRFSSATGFHLTGSSNLEGRFPVDLQIGPVGVQSISIALKPADQGVDFTVGATADAELGPFAVVVDGVGFVLQARFPNPPAGNLGPLDLDFAFRAPDGIGLALDAVAVTGGGYLAHDPQNAIYAGALDLSICGYAVKAYGLIQTSVPGGQPSYSFAAVISVQFLPAIDLPYDFTLDGVGGFIGVNRTINEDTIEAALWAHHLDGLLFPADPVAAAPQLISALESYFPAAEGRYVFGPLAKIGWAADIVTGEAALLLELPEPIRLMLIGDVQVGVPSNSPQLVLHVSFDGGIDFGKQLAFFDATLRDSRLESYPISGDLAFRYSWGNPAVFALALGGFNPQFQPPAGFPTLKRLAISIHSSVARIEAQSYLALTSNTLQFGARVELTAGTGSFNVHGWLGFDALCERNPLAFEFDLTAGVDLRAGTDVIASVHLDGTLSGPTPWHIAGKASLSLLFFDVTVHFDKTWGSTAAALPAPDPLPALTAALADRSSWSGTLPQTVRAAITPIGSPVDAGEAVLFDPASTLRITQRVAPLDQPITRFAGTPLAQTTIFTLDSLTAFGNPTTPSGITSEEFAPAQFLDLTDAEKLSLPSFSAFDAGVELAGDAIDLGQSSRTRAVITPISYITTTLDSRIDPVPKSSYTPSMTAVLALNDSAGGAQPGLGRYKPAASTPARVTLAGDQWTIASTSDLSVRADIPCDGSKLNAHLALSQYVAAHPDETSALQVVLTHEAA